MQEAVTFIQYDLLIKLSFLFLFFFKANIPWLGLYSLNWLHQIFNSLFKKKINENEKLLQKFNLIVLKSEQFVGREGQKDISPSLIFVECNTFKSGLYRCYSVWSVARSREKKKQRIRVRTYEERLKSMAGRRPRQNGDKTYTIRGTWGHRSTH